jgi:ferrous iron transport protein B
VFRRTLLRSDTRALIVELPSYSMPNARVLLTSVWQRVRVFLRRAGTIIFAISIVLSWQLTAVVQRSLAITIIVVAAYANTIA